MDTLVDCGNMTRTSERLTALKAERAKPGLHHDGHGLYLAVTEKEKRSWVYRYMMAGRAREMGLGPLHTVSLKQARERAHAARLLKLDGVDPIEHRRAARAQTRLDAAKAVTFKECAEGYIKAHRAGWRNGKHSAQWEATLRSYAGPVIGALPVQMIDTALVMKVIEPVWETKSETASRLRARIENVLDWAKVRGYREGENPARWRGHLDHLLPSRGKVHRVEHHAALPFAELPSFLVALREQQGVAARALEFAILTAGRTGEVRCARWSEFDLLNKTWTVPAERMKALREHRIPLSARALAILEGMQAHRYVNDGFVFPGNKNGRPINDKALLRLLRRMGRGDLTAHGFRATFKTWASERTPFQNEIVEAALAHVVGSKVEQAYQRGDVFEKRRKLMQQWATFCTSAPTEHGKVVSLQGR
jgi:integrase